MEVIITRSFLKDLVKLPKPVRVATDKVIASLKSAQNLQTTGLDIQRMEGQKKDENYYRIRIGDYRIGIENINPKVIVLMIASRGAIYSQFPPK